MAGMSASMEQAVPLPFTDRAAAGRILGARLLALTAAGETGLSLADTVVLALPRGGVPVGREVCRALQVPLDVLVTRKIGYPLQPELGVGAVAEGGLPVFDSEMLARLGLTTAALRPVVAAERSELDRRIAAYRAGPAPELRGRHVIVVDDGLATGGTARAALRAVRAAGAGRCVLAVPVAAPSSATAMQGEADLVVVLAAPPAFRAVGEWYQSFGQLTDADVVRLLAAAPDQA